MSRVGPSKLMTPTLSLKAFFQVDNAMTTQSLQRSCEPVLVLCQVIVSGPITALAASSRLHILGGEHQALAVDARSVHKDIMGP